MKYNILFLLSTALFFASCGGDSENPDSSDPENNSTALAAEPNSKPALILDDATLVENLQAELRRVNNLPNLQVQWHGESKKLRIFRGASGKGFSDLTPLKTTKLSFSKLDLTRNHDLSNQSVQALKDLPLEALLFSGSKIDDLTFMEGMPLEELSINVYGDRYFPKCKISDLKPLRGMKLKLLYAEGCEITDLSVLKGMPLEKLLLSGCESLVSLEALNETTTLKELRLNNTSIGSLEPLSNLRLNTLWMNKTKVSDLEPLKDMTLASLKADETQVSSIANLNGERLWHLSVQVTPLNDLSPLAQLPNLTQLFFSESQVQDFGPMSNCKKLSFVSITDPQKAKKLDVVRELPISNISIKPTRPYQHSIMTMEDFWKWVADPSLKLINSGWDRLLIEKK
jgi:Leucine-rich repeat (LRR) protein